MANSVIAGHSGHDYQARFFWIHASALRNPQMPHVLRVTYEADEPRSFDDVVVHYDPPRPSRGDQRIAVTYHQVKYHVTGAGRFGYADLVDPAFVGGETVSLLQRLAEAKQKAPTNSEFVLVTTDRIADGDLLGELVSSDNHSLRLDKLSKGGPRSRMGKVRACWRDHLGMTSDDDLYSLLKGLRIQHASASLEQLREQVNLHFQLVGLCGCHQTLEFRFDGAARALKATGRHQLTRESFEALCAEEKWIIESTPSPYAHVALRSFPDGATSPADAPPERTLSLLGHFEARHLRVGADWNTQIQPMVEKFLAGIRAQHRQVRLFLDAHLSIAFLAGACLGLKSGVTVELVQKGRGGVSVWRVDDAKTGPEPTVDVIERNAGHDVAVVVGYSREALVDVTAYLDASQPSVGRVVNVHAGGRTGPGSVQGGAHAAAISDAIEASVRQLRLPIGATVHLFLAAPNAVSFFLGQHREAMGRCVLYEFDFSRSVDGSYHPSFRIG